MKSPYFTQQVQASEKLPGGKKKVCRFCGHNEYEGNYTKHLKRNHKDIMENRAIIKNISKHLSAEQLEQIKQFIIELKKNSKN